MSHLGYSKNECGTRIALHKCDTCGIEYTVTAPKADYSPENFQDCLAPECASYDVNRDMDLLFMTDDEIAREKKIVPINLKARRAALQRELINK